MRKRVRIPVIIVFFFSLTILSLADLQPEMLRKGLTLIKLGQWQQAISFFQQEVNSNPAEAQAYFYLGLAQEKAGDVKAAISNYERAIQLKPAEAEFHYSLGRLYLSSGDEEKALQHFAQAESISPQSIYGVLARQEKLQLLTKRSDRQLVEEWLKKEAELKEAKEKEKEKPEQVSPGQEQPATAQGEAEKVEEREPAEKLMKVLRHGREKQRRQASETLLSYPEGEIKPFSQLLIGLLRRERVTDIRKNIISLVGMTKTVESIDTLLRILSNPQERFEYKLVALSSLSGIKEENVVTALRTTLQELVAARIQEREQAKRNLSDLEKKIEEIETEKLTLEAEITALETKKNELQNKISGGYLEPGQPPGVPPAAGLPAMAQGTLKPAEIVKIQKDIKAMEKEIEEKRRRVELLGQKKQEAEEKKGRYVALLSKKQGQAGEKQPPGQPWMPQTEITGSEETEEERNQQQFALSLIDALGALRDRESLPVIRSAWQEFGNEEKKLSYSLALARLGDYSQISALVERLQQDLPEGDTNQQAEVSFRAAVVEVVGEYVKANQEQELLELLQYLAEESAFPEIKEAALDALAFVKGEKRVKKVPVKTTTASRPTPAGGPKVPEFPVQPVPPPR